ncbi:MAG: hypothetical protein JKY53_06205 [Flavobacteriales bacterium]|nr:hypothetical protein [Flavobacteriales bacterium]
MKVKNITGYRPPSCGCDSCEEHWEKATNSTFTTCVRKRCGNSATVGGHVINYQGNSSNVSYIVPLCNTCNSIPTDEYYDINSWALPILSTDTRAC